MTRDEKADEMKDRLSNRFESESDTSDTTDKTDNTSKMDTTDMSNMPAQSDGVVIGDDVNVKNLPSRLMYLPEGLLDELSLQFDELAIKYKREHGVELEKNRHFYPALVKAGLEGKDVEEVLDELEIVERLE